MNILPSQKKAAPKSVVPIVSTFRVPHYRRMRGRRYNARGVDIGPCGPRKPIPDPHTQRLIERAWAEAAAKLAPEEGAAFDLAVFRPMPGKLLLVRRELITEEAGVALPENKHYHRPGYIVVKVGDRVTDCAAGDIVLFQKRTKPKSVRLGGNPGFYIANESSLVAILEATV